MPSSQALRLIFATSFISEINNNLLFLTDYISSLITSLVSEKHWCPCRFSASGTPSISFTAWNNRSLFFFFFFFSLFLFLIHAQFIECWSSDICYLTLWWTVWFWRRKEFNVSLWNSESWPKERNDTSQNVQRRMTYWLILSLFGCFIALLLVHVFNRTFPCKFVWFFFSLYCIS
jgi:Ca2+/Na+ antiporter